MRLITIRRLLAAGLLSTSLTACGYFQTASSTGQQATPVAVEVAAATAAPTVAAPTAVLTIAAPAPTVAVAPTVAPANAGSKLPALTDPAWHELARADLDGDSADERLLFMFGEGVEPRQGFADSYLAGRAMMADVLVVAEADDTIALQVDRTGVRAGGEELRAFSPDAPVASFVAAIDAESPLRLVLLPLAASGLQQGDTLLVSWDEAAGSFSAEAIAIEGLTTAPASDAAAEPLDADGQREIAAWALEHLHAVGAGQAVVGALAQAGDFALAQANVFGEERPRSLFLRHDADGWNVVLDTTTGGAAPLENAGVPLSLAQADPRLDAVAAAAAHLQDPRGQGWDGSLVVEAFDGSWAKIIFAPTHRERYDPATMYVAGTQSGWQVVTLGTAFLPEDYEKLGIPPSIR